MNRNTTLRVAALLGAIGVAAGAFGAHALADRLPAADLAIFETAVRYQLVHALAAAIAALLPAGRRPRLAGACFIAGIALFSGTLYALVLSGTRWLGAVTPVGGVLLIAGWILLAMSAGERADAEGRSPPGGQ